jgi:hypothetical protein
VFKPVLASVNKGSLVFGAGNPVIAARVDDELFGVAGGAVDPPAMIQRHDLIVLTVDDEEIMQAGEPIRQVELESFSFEQGRQGGRRLLTGRRYQR